MLKHRNSFQKSLCHVVRCPYLCSSDSRRPRGSKRMGQGKSARAWRSCAARGGRLLHAVQDSLHLVWQQDRGGLALIRPALSPKGSVGRHVRARSLEPVCIRRDQEEVSKGFLHRDMHNTVTQTGHATFPRVPNWGRECKDPLQLWKINMPSKSDSPRSVAGAMQDASIRPRASSP